MLWTVKESFYEFGHSLRKRFALISWDDFVWFIKRFFLRFVNIQERIACTIYDDCISVLELFVGRKPFHLTRVWNGTNGGILPTLLYGKMVSLVRFNGSNGEQHEHGHASCPLRPISRWLLCPWISHRIAGCLNLITFDFLLLLTNLIYEP
ncbi:hypothetical protein MLD38_020916 [Melastoma candidum]|uniref:Uncharacterized protein n=1 Tax=Melastoma candidum TaxID=119954 RepID=A0ACB9QMJ5_9MYRT|nr:hypothetical protein MLD38_020916 [Melastoma candidum]